LQQSDLALALVMFKKDVALVELCGLLHAYTLLEYRLTPITNRNNIIIFFCMILKCKDIKISRATCVTTIKISALKVRVFGKK
jgi:hypothetical protein